MPKPKMPTLRGAPGTPRDAWREVEQYRRRHSLTTDEMARKLSTSAGAYRGWKSRGQMPLPMWEQFQGLLVQEGTVGAIRALLIELPKTHWQLLRALGEDNFSAGVRLLIEEHIARR